MTSEIGEPFKPDVRTDIMAQLGHDALREVFIDLTASAEQESQSIPRAIEQRFPDDIPSQVRAYIVSAGLANRALRQDMAGNETSVKDIFGIPPLVVESQMWELLTNVANNFEELDTLEQPPAIVVYYKRLRAMRNIGPQGFATHVTTTNEQLQRYLKQDYSPDQDLQRLQDSSALLVLNANWRRLIEQTFAEEVEFFSNSQMVLPAETTDLQTLHDYLDPDQISGDWLAEHSSLGIKRARPSLAFQTESFRMWAQLQRIDCQHRLQEQAVS